MTNDQLSVSHSGEASFFFFHINNYVPVYLKSDSKPVTFSEVREGDWSTFKANTTVFSWCTESNLPTYRTIISERTKRRKLLNVSLNLFVGYVYLDIHRTASWIEPEPNYDVFAIEYEGGVV